MRLSVQQPLKLIYPNLTALHSFRFVRFASLREVLRKLDRRVSRGKITAEVFEETEAVAMGALTSISNLYAELRQIESFNLKYSQIEKEKPKQDLQGDLMDANVAKVEILWNDRIESVSFTKPKDSAYLTQQTKESFLLR